MFSKEQIDELSAPLSREVVKTREGKFSYIEGWHALAEANRIFGFDGWSSETMDARCVVERERASGQHSITYIAKVRVTVGNIFHDGCGAGTGINADPGLAHEKAIKEAETDARKRALMQFGNPFGLALYDKEQANVADPVDEADLTRQRYIDACNAKIDAFDPLLDDPKPMLIWWADQHKARDDLLNPAQRIEMRARLTAKLPARTGASQASQT